MNCLGCGDEYVEVGTICDYCMHSQPEDWVGHVIPQVVRDAQRAAGIVALKDGQICPQNRPLFPAIDGEAESEAAA